MNISFNYYFFSLPYESCCMPSEKKEKCACVICTVHQKTWLICMVVQSRQLQTFKLFAVPYNSTTLQLETLQYDAYVSTGIPTNVLYVYLYVCMVYVCMFVCVSTRKEVLLVHMILLYTQNYNSMIYNFLLNIQYYTFVKRNYVFCLTFYPSSISVSLSN